MTGQPAAVPQKPLETSRIQSPPTESFASEFKALTIKHPGDNARVFPAPSTLADTPRMTRTQSGANWSDVPSLSQLSLAALLRLTAMFVVGVASLLLMRPSRRPGECHADATPAMLPEANSANPSKEPDPAATSSQPNFKGNTSHYESFSGKARSAAPRESRFERQRDWRFKPQSPPSDNKDSRDALRLPENDGGCGWKISQRKRL